jgi:hypothetical protein
MERRLGRIQARHPQVNDLFDVRLRDTPAGVRLVWEMKKDREAWRDLREGAYMLRTNLQADSAEQMWSMYMAHRTRLRITPRSAASDAVPVWSCAAESGPDSDTGENR